MGADRQIAAPAFVRQFRGATARLPRGNAAPERETSCAVDLARVQRARRRCCGAVRHIDGERHACNWVRRIGNDRHMAVPYHWDGDSRERRNASPSLQRCSPQCVLGVLHDDRRATNRRHHSIRQAHSSALAPNDLIVCNITSSVKIR